MVLFFICHGAAGDEKLNVMLTEIALFGSAEILTMKARTIDGKMRRLQLITMLMKFAIVGLSGVGVNMAVYVPLTNLGFHYLLAAICSFFAAVTNNFLWNMLWTFRGRAPEKSVPRKYITFFVISVVNLGVNLAILRLFVEFLSIKEAIAQLGAIAITSVFNFTLNYLITFAESRDKQSNEVAAYETGYHPNL